MKPLAAALISFAVVACAPRYLTPGPATTLPRLEDDSVLMPDGARLALKTWMAAPPRALILALHGFNDYGNAFVQPAVWLSQYGISTFAVDQRGFGDSPARGRWPGAEALVGDLDTLVGLLRARYGGLPLFVLGESMGGAVAIAWAANNGKGKADGLILAAPAVWGWRALNPAYKAVLYVTAHTTPWAKLTGRNLDIRPSDNIEMLRALSRDPKVIKKTRVDAIYGLVTLMDRAYEQASSVEGRTLLLYGKHDQVIPAAPIRHVAAALGPDARCVLYPKGYHMLLRDLQRETVWRDVLAFVTNPTATPSSGEERAASAAAALRRLP